MAIQTTLIHRIVSEKEATEVFSKRHLKYLIWLSFNHRIGEVLSSKSKAHADNSVMMDVLS